MKRILLLTDAPSEPLYSPRVRYLISNLSKRGWQFIVVSERKPHTDFTFADCKHIQFPYYSDDSSWHNKYLWFADKLFNHKERLLYRFIKKQVQQSEVDIIFCSSFNTFPLPTAARLAKEWGLPFVVDLRDIAEQWGETSYAQHPIRTPFPPLNRFLTRLYTRQTVRQRNNAIKQADELITVSPWHQQVLQRLHPSVHLIYNGFDEQAFRPNDVPTDTFNITYTGKIYDFRLRDPHLLFQALGELLQDGHLPDKLHVHFYCETDIQPKLYALAKQYDILKYVHLHNFVTNKEVIDILWHSSVSVLLTNSVSNQGAHGIMTTKFFEVLGVEKPVLCVRSDEECLAQVIRQTNAGLAATNVEEVKAFILNKYHEWKQNGFTRQAVHGKEQFSRQFQAQQFEKILSTFLFPLSTFTAHLSPLTFTDICWTLFYSNTTYDFLHIKGSWWNSLLFKLFGIDLARKRGTRKLKGYTREELLAQAETFYRDYLEPRKIKPVWDLVSQTKNDIILVSGTLDIIAEVVAKHIGAKAFYATELEFKDGVCTGRYRDFLLRKKELLKTGRLKPHTVITDNLTDIDLIRHATDATIVTYNNRARWQKILPAGLQIAFIDAERERY